MPSRDIHTRINTHKQHTRHRRQVGDKEITLDDMWRLDLQRLDGWTLVQARLVGKSGGAGWEGRREAGRPGGWVGG